MSLVARILLAYDGTDFHGWQVQPDRRTVQGELTRRLRRLIPLEGYPPGAGRTDAGVHAYGQVASVSVPGPEYLERLRRALPRMMPPDVLVRSVDAAAEGFHARFDATGRHYVYRILDAPDPMRRRDHLITRGALDIESMQRALPGLLGEHDCTSLCKASSLEPGKTRCEILRAELVPEGAGWALHIVADRFLHSMVRNIVGVLLEVGRGRRPDDPFPAILQARERSAAGATAPAHGLSLHEVHYAGRTPVQPGDERS